MIPAGLSMTSSTSKSLSLRQWAVEFSAAPSGPRVSKLSGMLLGDALGQPRANPLLDQWARAAGLGC